MPRQINSNICSSCGTCVEACPVEAIVRKNDMIQIDPNECVDCATCWRICPTKSVTGGPKEHLELIKK